MKHILIILISILLLSSPVISHPKGEHTLYLWESSSGKKVWKHFGDKDIHKQYEREWKNGQPNGLGIMTEPNSNWKYVGEWKDGHIWNGIHHYKGEIEIRYVNGK